MLFYSYLAFVFKLQAYFLTLSERESVIPDFFSRPPFRLQKGGDRLYRTTMYHKSEGMCHCEAGGRGNPDA
jgi:hypothetical protein